MSAQFPKKIFVTRHSRGIMAPDYFGADETIEGAMDHGARLAGQSVDIAVYRLERVTTARTKVVIEGETK